MACIESCMPSFACRHGPTAVRQWHDHIVKQYDLIPTRRQTCSMAPEIALNMSTRLVLNKDIEVEIKKDGSKRGTVLISKGNIGWVPAGNHVNKKRLSWTRFAELMVEHGKDAQSK